MALSTNNFEINGVIDTKNTVLQNIQTMASACGVWLTFDGTAGKWSVVINKAGPSVKSFNDSNIISGINVSGTGVNEMYNAVSVSFPHADLQGQTDYVEYEVPLADRYPNERDNVLQMNLTCINNPIQAQYVGIVALKQSRADKVIQFTSDYSALGTKAGDIIDVTSTMYGFSGKKFRVTKVSEDDSNDGTLKISITALEYDDNIYTADGLKKKERNKKTGIIPKSMNDVLTAKDTAAVSTIVTDTINPPWKRMWKMPIMTLTSNGEYHTNLNFGIDFTAPYTGNYRLTCLFNWGALTRSDLSFPIPPLGVLRGNMLYICINGVDKLPTSLYSDQNGSYSGITGSQFTPLYDDYYLILTFAANKGDILFPKWGYLTNWGDTFWTPPGYPTYDTVSTDQCVMMAVGELEYVGNYV